jgi:autotransporter-associated beta strand protein
VLYTDTFAGTPIATDVTNGLKANYDTFDLAAPQSLTAGTVYFFNILGPGGSYYGLAKDATGTYSSGIALNLASSGPPYTLADTQPTHDFVFFINGTPGGAPVTENSQWNFNGSGNWTDATKWDDGVGNSGYPDTASSTATFGTGTTNSVTGSPVVTVTAPIAIGTMNFTATNAPTGGYTITGTSTLALGGGGINVSSGTHTISAPVNLTGSANTFTVASGATLTVDTISGGGYGLLTQAGTGTLNVGELAEISAVATGTLNIMDGTDTGGFIFAITSTNVGTIFNLGANNLIYANGLYGDGAINIGAGTTLMAAQYGGFEFDGILTGSGALSLGSNAGGPGTSLFTGASTGFSGPITVAWTNTLQVGAGTVLGNASSTNTLTLDSGSLQAIGNVTLPQNVTIEDTQQIANNNTTIDTQTNTLTLSGHISGGNSLQKIGTGELVLDASNSYTGGTNVTAGTLVVGVSGALPSNGALAISGGSLVQLGTGSGTETLSSLSIDSTSELDITNNHMYITYSGTDPFSTIAGYIKSGYNGGAWNGPGIISSAAQTLTNGLKYGIGYADGADGKVSGLSSGQIEVKYTLLGDANLDGIVNAADFTILAANFNQPVTSWDQGDFNYDGLVNAADFTDLAANFNQSDSGADVSAGDVAALDAFAAAYGLSIPASVPEPASMGLMIAAGVGLLSRRGRRLNKH